MAMRWTIMEYMRKLRQWLLTPFLVVVAVIVVVLEATLWRWLTALGQVLGRFAFFAQLERLVERLSPGAVVAVFALPFVPIIPLLKVGEIWLIRHHHDAYAKALDECRRRMDQAVELGSPYIVASPPQEVVDLGRATERFGELMGIGREVGVIPSMEFLGFVDGIKNVASAWQIAQEPAIPGPRSWRTSFT